MKPHAHKPWFYYVFSAYLKIYVLYMALFGYNHTYSDNLSFTEGFVYWSCVSCICTFGLQLAVWFIYSRLEPKLNYRKQRHKLYRILTD